MSGRAKEFLKAQWDTLATIGAALALTVLTMLDVIDGEVVSAAVLGVLALVCATIVKDRHAREGDREDDRTARRAAAEQVGAVLAVVQSIDGQLRAASELQAVAPPGIGQRFTAAYANATRWRFKGGTGTYLRAKTLPGLARRRVAVEVWAEIIPPDDVTVCQRYGSYRRRLPGAPSSALNGWTTEHVRVESYATIVAAVWYSCHTSLRAQVALSSSMSTFRYDLSDSFVIITNDDPQARAVLTDGPSNFFDSIEQELVVSFEQARRLDVTAVRMDSRELTTDAVRSILSDLPGLAADSQFLTDDVCRQIALKAISEEHAGELGFQEGGARNPYPG